MKISTFEKEPNLHALIIDDDKQMRKLFRIFAEEEGYTVTEVDDGNDGIKTFQDKNCFQLVITDILMPNSSGIDVIKALRERCSKAKIIAVSGGNMVDSATHLKVAEALGADHVFEKPINIEDFRKVIQDISK